MRAGITRKLLDRFERGSSARLQRMQLQILADLAARSFGQARIRIRQLPPEEGLAAYAKYSRRCMERFAAGANVFPGADAARVYEEARALGERVRRLSGLTDPEDLRRLVFLLYRNIGITMQGSLPGEIVISRCYFSDFYTPDQCALMSRTDAGIISGIMGGGTLQFQQRITEGCSCCHAQFRNERGTKK